MHQVGRLFETCLDFHSFGMQKNPARSLWVSSLQIWDHRLATAHLDSFPTRSYLIETFSWRILCLRVSAKQVCYRKTRWTALRFRNGIPLQRNQLQSLNTSTGKGWDRTGLLGARSVGCPHLFSLVESYRDRWFDHV